MEKEIKGLKVEMEKLRNHPRYSSKENDSERTYANMASSAVSTEEEENSRSLELDMNDKQGLAREKGGQTRSQPTKRCLRAPRKGTESQTREQEVATPQAKIVPLKMTNDLKIVVNRQSCISPTESSLPKSVDDGNWDIRDEVSAGMVKPQGPLVDHSKCMVIKGMPESVSESFTDLSFSSPIASSSGASETSELEKNAQSFKRFATTTSARFSRKQNVVIKGAPESTATIPKERVKHDLDLLQVYAEALLRDACLEIWTRALEEGFEVDVVYIDFRKAFDTVAQQRLLHKLSAIGIRGNLLNWIGAFLVGRKQRVCIGDDMSEWEALISRISLSTQKRLQRLISEEDLGDRKPTQLRRRFQQLADGQKMDAIMFNQLFLQRLPPSVQAILAPYIPSWTVQMFAETADRILQYSQSPVSVNVPSRSTIAPSIEDVIKRLDALTLEVPQFRATHFISQYTTDIRFLKCLYNRVADCLSRPDINDITRPSIDLERMAELKNQLTFTESLQHTSLHLEAIPLSTTSGTILCDVSHDASRPVVPSEMRRDVFVALHNLAHPGIRTTQRLVSERFVWPSMNTDIRQ
ncbi:hypothetical protein SprV_0301255700 [Sparganum proliferum]